MEIKTKYNIGDMVNTPDGGGKIIEIVISLENGCTYRVDTKSNNSYYKEDKLSMHILTEKEREYLSNVIKPFRDKVLTIRKRKYSISALECINIIVESIGEGKTEGFSLPYFEEGNMYKGMEVNRHYTLEELRLQKEK